MARAASYTCRSSASASSRPSSAATWSCSCNASRSVARPVARWSASRTSSSRRRASARPLARGVGQPGGGYGTQGGGVAQAAPRLAEVGFQHGYWSSPWRAARSAQSSWSSGEALGGLVAPVGEDRRCAARRSAPGRPRGAGRPGDRVGLSNPRPPSCGPPRAYARSGRGRDRGPRRGTRGGRRGRRPPCRRRRRAAGAGPGRCAGTARRGRSRRRRPGRRPERSLRQAKRPDSHSSVSPARAARRGGRAAPPR